MGTAIPTAGLVQILALMGLIELAWLPASNYSGDYGVGWFGEDIVDPEIKARKLNVELNNGRASMLAVFGNMVGEAATGQTLAESWGDGAILESTWPKLLKGSNNSDEYRSMYQ